MVSYSIATPTSLKKLLATYLILGLVFIYLAIASFIIILLLNQKLINYWHIALLRTFDVASSVLLQVVAKESVAYENGYKQQQEYFNMNCFCYITKSSISILSVKLSLFNMLLLPLSILQYQCPEGHYPGQILVLLSN